MKKCFLFSCLIFISRITLSSQQITPHDFVPEQRYNLKNGYELSITDAVKQNDHVCSILLSKNGGDAFFPRSVYLYDLKNGKKYKLNKFLQKEQEKNLFWLNILTWFDCFKFGNITFENVEIVFYGCYKPLFDEAGEFFDTEDYSFSFIVER